MKSVSIGTLSPRVHSKTFGIDSSVKTNRGRTLNVRSGVHVSHTSDGPFHEFSASAESASFKLSNKNGNRSTRLSGPSVSAKGTTVVGGGAGYHAKASFAEVSHSETFKIGKITAKLDVTAGIGASVGGKVSVASNRVDLGASGNVLPGVYLGANLDIRG